MKKAVVGIIIVAVVLVTVFAPLVEVLYTVQHRHTEPFYEDRQPKERLVIRFETYYERVPYLNFYAPDIRADWNCFVSHGASYVIVEV